MLLEWQSDKVTVFLSHESPSCTENIRIEWKSVIVSLLPIPKGVTVTADLCFFVADFKTGCGRTGFVVESDGRLVGGGLLGQVELARRVREREAGGEGEKEGAGSAEGGRRRRRRRQGEFERGD